MSLTAPNRGLKPDGNNIPTTRRRTAFQKNLHPELMLGQIANFSPIISCSSIVKNSTSIRSVWQAIRAHYGVQSTSARFLDFSNIKLEVDEHPKDLFQHLMTFEEFDENDSDIDFTGFEARGMKKATVKVRKQAVKQARIPRKQKLHGRSNFQTLK